MRRLTFSFSRIAAMLIIALLSGFSISYYLFKSKPALREVVWFETVVPRGEKSKLVLPDGSVIWVNSESTISYPGNFMEGHREIKLKGEAYFEVQKLQDMPFIVTTKDYSIRVTGTRFNVMAYADINRTETFLIEGNVEIQKGKQTIPLDPGQYLIYSGNQFTIRKEPGAKAASWKDNIFDFDRITFKELVVKLERWYNVDIEMMNPELDDIIYSGIFKNEETIWQVLNTFQLTLPIRYERVGFRKFLIKKK